MTECMTCGGGEEFLSDRHPFCVECTNSYAKIYRERDEQSRRGKKSGTAKPVKKQRASTKKPPMTADEVQWLRDRLGMRPQDVGPQEAVYAVRKRSAGLRHPS